MNKKTIVSSLLALALPLIANGATILVPGDSVTWQFQFHYDSTVQINHPSQSFGGYVILDYQFTQAIPLQYRLDFYEDFGSPDPIQSLLVSHLTGLQDQTGMPVIWTPEFAPPFDAWSDFNGKLRITILSGEMRGLNPDITMLIPTVPGSMDYYQAQVIPEPSSMGLILVSGLLIAYRPTRRQKSIPAEQGVGGNGG